MSLRSFHNAVSAGISVCVRIGFSNPRIVLGIAVIGSLAPQAAHAIAWNNGSVDSTVSIPADYPTLAACGTAFSATAGINANWTISVTSGTYTEPASAAFANTIAAGKTVTLKPAASSAVTFNFTKATANSSTGIEGGLIIGAPDVTTSDTVVATNGFVIDGSNNGTSSRDMTFTNLAQATFAAQVIRVYGASTTGTIRNVIVVNNCASSTANAGIEISAHHLNSGADLFPSGWTISNCNISSNLGTQSSAIGSDAFGTLVSGSGATNGLVISGNTLLGAIRSIVIRNNSNTTITANTIRASQPGNQNSFGISHVGANGLAGWTITIAGNKFDQLSAAAVTSGGSGITAMDLSGAGTVAGNYLVYNNMIAGFSLPTAGSADLLYRGIYSGSVNASTGSFKVYNNSIYMPGFAGVSAVTLVNVAAIALNPGAAAACPFDVKNNIIYMSQGGPATGAGIGIALKTGSTGAFTSDYNVFNIAGANAVFGRQGGTNFLTLPTWQGSASTPDLNGQNLDPTATALSTWSSATDLHFTPKTAAPGGMLPGIPLALVSTDIDGLIRDTTNPMRGADELGPVVAQVTVPDHGHVDVTFFATASAMGSGVTTPANYTISGTGQGTLANNPDSVVLLNGRTYRLGWNSGSSVTGGTITITASNSIQDSLGNPLGSPNSQSQSNVLSAASDWTQYE